MEPGLLEQVSIFKPINYMKNHMLTPFRQQVLLIRLRNTLAAGTGLLNNKFTLDARASMM